MTSEQYRTYLIESIKIGAQMMYDMAGGHCRKI